MATERISLYDRVTQHAVPFMSDIPPLHDSTKAPWKGLKLQHYRIGNSERPEATTTSYLAATCLDGSYETEYDGGATGRFCVSTRPGSVSLVGPGRLPPRRSKGRVEFLIMEVAPKYLVWAAEELGLDGRLEVQPLWSGEEEQARHVMLALHNELIVGCPSGQLFAEYVGLSFATMMLTRHAATPGRPAVYRGGLSHYKLRQVLAFINDNLATTLSLVDMANLIQMGPCHFARAFKASTGFSPHQYILRRRIDRALEVLKQTHVNLADLAYKLGFSSQGHFTTVFRKMVGVPPNSYHEQLLSLRDVEVCPAIPQPEART